MRGLLIGVLLIAAFAVLLNFVSAHLGSTVLFELPDQIPALGGPYTLEALAFGATGGLTIGLGGLLALSPGRRRRATDPVSGAAPLDELEDVPSHASQAAPIGNGNGDAGDREVSAEPVVTAGR